MLPHEKQYHPNWRFCDRLWHKRLQMESGWWTMWHFAYFPSDIKRERQIALKLTFKFRMGVKLVVYSTAAQYSNILRNHLIMIWSHSSGNKIDRLFQPPKLRRKRKQRLTSLTFYHFSDKQWSYGVLLGIMLLTYCVMRTGSVVGQTCDIETWSMQDLYLLHISSHVLDNSCPFCLRFNFS